MQEASDDCGSQDLGKEGGSPPKKIFCCIFSSLLSLMEALGKRFWLYPLIMVVFVVPWC